MQAKIVRGGSYLRPLMQDSFVWKEIFCQNTNAVNGRIDSLKALFKPLQKKKRSQAAW